jgi:hypothetical protein
MNLSDTHLVLLSAAAQRDDHLLIAPEGLTTKAVEKPVWQPARCLDQVIEARPDLLGRPEPGQPVGERQSRAELG